MSVAKNKKSKSKNVFSVSARSEVLLEDMSSKISTMAEGITIIREVQEQHGKQLERLDHIDDQVNALVVISKDHSRRLDSIDAKLEKKVDREEFERRMPAVGKM